jgi:hypothetical protein
MRWTKLGGFVASATILVPTVGSAHHSFAAHFEMDRFAEVEGRITAIEWINPHVLIYVEAPPGTSGKSRPGPSICCPGWA